MKRNYHFTFRVIYLLAFIIINNNVLAQDESVKDMQANATKEIKKEKIDSGKTWKTGGLFNLNIRAGKPK